MSAIADSTGKRLRLYRALRGRNRIVGLLRFVVPAIGVLLLAGLLVQIYLTSQSRQYGLGSIQLDRTKVTVETPRYAGVMTDGTSYKVTGADAVASVDAL